MTGREIIKRFFDGNELPVIPTQIVFFDINSIKKFLPDGNIFTKDYLVKVLQELENYIVDVTPYQIHDSHYLRECNYLCRPQLEHSCTGGGVLKTKVVEEDEDTLIFEFETGGRWKIRKKPFQRSFVSFPISGPEDLSSFSMPDPDDADRYQDVEEAVNYFSSRGFFTSAEVHGFFSGIWYRHYGFEDLLKSMVKKPEFVRELTRKIGEFNLATARNFLERGVDSILFCDDLGDNRGLLISPEHYREFFLPWHKKMADLCHSYGAVCHMHSHGNIYDILDDIVDAGIDLLNPVEPGDGMDIKRVLQNHGGDMKFYAATTRSLDGLSGDEIEKLVLERLNVAKNNPFILRMGGITENLDHSQFELYQQTCKHHKVIKGV